MIKSWLIWWRRSRELTVSLALTLLVLLSLVTSALIWTGTPGQIAVDRPSFFSRATIGSHRSVTAVSIPSSMLLWTANNELYRFSGDSQTVIGVLSALARARAVSGKVHAARSVSPLSGAYLQLNLNDFHTLATPVGMWLQGPQWAGWPPISGPLFLSPTATQGQYTVRYQTTRGTWQGVIAKAGSGVAAAFTPNAQSTPYATVPFGTTPLDLPYDQIEMPILDWTLAHPVTSHLVDAFFSDPTTAVGIADGPDSTLYTDGIRGVRVLGGPFGEVAEFLSPSARLRGVKPNTIQNLAAAVAAVNQNGGFVGQNFAALQTQTSAGQEFQFDEIVSGWPLFGSVGQMNVWVQEGNVVRLRRNLDYLQELLDEQRVRVLSGSQLLSLLGSRTRGIVSIRLGFGAQMIAEDTVELDPIYRLQYRSGRVQYLSAQTGASFVETGMSGP